MISASINRVQILLGTLAIAGVFAGLLAGCSSADGPEPVIANHGSPVTTPEPMHPAAATPDALLSSASSGPTLVPAPRLDNSAAKNEVIDPDSSDNVTVDTLADQLTAMVDNADGDMAIVIALPDGTVLYDHNAYEPMEAASLYKLGIMVELFRQRDAGLLSFDEAVELHPGFFVEGADSIGEEVIGAAVELDVLLRHMITLSSNVAASALLFRLGTDNVNATVAAHGLSQTEIRWSPHVDPHGFNEEPIDDGELIEDSEPPDRDGPTEEDQPASDETHGEGEAALDPIDEDALFTDVHPYLTGAMIHPVSALLGLVRADEANNVTTAADMALLFRRLVNGEVVSHEASAEMLRLLAEQQINDRLPAWLPPGTTVAHKTGNLERLVHDAGVIETPGGSVIVVVLTDGIDEDQAVEIIVRVGWMTYQALSQ